MPLRARFYRERTQPGGQDEQGVWPKQVERRQAKLVSGMKQVDGMRSLEIIDRIRVQRGLAIMAMRLIERVDVKSPRVQVQVPGLPFGKVVVYQRPDRREHDSRVEEQ